MVGECIQLNQELQREANERVIFGHSTKPKNQPTMLWYTQHSNQDIMKNVILGLFQTPNFTYAECNANGRTIEFSH